MHIRKICGTILVLSLGACNAAPPTDDLVRAAILRSRPDQTVVIDKIMRSREITEQPQPGIENYLVEYEARLRWPEGQNVDCLRFQIRMGRCDFIDEADVKTRGASSVVRGRMIFARVEDGWRLVGNYANDSMTGQVFNGMMDQLEKQQRPLVPVKANGQSDRLNRIRAGLQ